MIEETNKIKEKHVKILRDYFQIDNYNYYYNLTRDKEAFNTGTMSFDDFEEFDEETVNDLAEYIVKHLKTKAYWINTKDYISTEYGSLEIKRCSNCDREITIDDYDEYCPHCGARMNEGAE